MYIKIFQVQTKTKGKKQLRNTSKTVDRICQLVAERKEERDFKYDLKALRQNGENTEVQKALEKKRYNFTKKKKSICILCFTTYWVYFINKRWFAVKF